MKYPILIFAAILLSMFLNFIDWQNTQAANHHHNQQQVHVAVPFAVPTAVPVAIYSPVAYANQAQPYVDPPQSQEDLLLEKLATLVAAKLEGKPLKAYAEKPAYPLFAANCATCHAKGDPDKGKPQFVSLDQLSGDQIDDCLSAVLDDSMPKGKKLAPEVNGALLKEMMLAKKALKAAALKAEATKPDDKPEPMP